MVARFGKAREVALRELVARALARIGNTLLDKIGDPIRVQRLFEQGLLLDLPPGYKDVLDANYAYTLALHSGNVPAALEHISKMLANKSTFSESGRSLLRGLASLGEPSTTKWQSMLTHVFAAVENGDEALWSNYIDDLQRLLWYVIVQGKGTDFLNAMVERNFQLKFAPLYHAFAATLEGEDYLLKINPETRQAAIKIYEGLSRQLRLYPKGV